MKMKLDRKFPQICLTAAFMVLTPAASPVFAEANLIQNPSLETDADGNNVPDQWFRGNWGTNNAVFTYPVAGADDARAAKVEITSYADGDAKWFFSDVPVVAGKTYNFSDSYISDTNTAITIRYANSSGAFTYVDLAFPVSTANWQTASATFTPPAGTVSLTIFHLINRVGSLAVDNFNLSESGTAPDPTPMPVPGDSFDQGFVSLSFDDGWNSQRDNAVSVLDNAGLKGTFYAITNESIRPAILNPSLETDVDNNKVPDNWSKNKWGTNAASFTYPVTGIDGAKAAKVTITSYSDGDAKWYFKDVKALPDREYKFSDRYKSTVKTYVTARFTKNNGSLQYVDIGQAAASSSSWGTFSANFYVPSDVKSITIFHLIKSVGSLTIDNAFLDVDSPYLNTNDLLVMQRSGHEVSAHTKTHPSLVTLNATQLQDEVSGSRQALVSAGFAPIASLAYPYGDYNDTVKTAVKNAGFASGRSVESGFNTKSSDKYALQVQNVEVTTTVETVKSWIDTAREQKSWLILVFHQVDNSGNQWGTTPEVFKGIVDYLKAQNVPVKTVTDGVAQM